MFVDHAKIRVKGGRGGDGAVSFRREKYVPDGGPDGGDGGRGGNVVAVADPNLRTLMDDKYRRSYEAPDGEKGSKRNRFGKSAEDQEMRLPVGTVIKDQETDKIIADLKEPGERVIIAHGGRGGRGNVRFKSSTRRSPGFAEQGRFGEEREIILELKMIADVGLIGFPNVGKSTLLSVTTKARPKIANYHFTTLTPNLGVVEGPAGQFVLADIPGLIEGASEGIGLGHDFLRHIERTRLLVHVVDVSGIEGRDPIEDFDAINKELSRYGDQLKDRPQLVVANKIDILQDEALLTSFEDEMQRRGFEVFRLSAATTEGVDPLLARIAQVLNSLEPIEMYDEEDYYVPERVFMTEDDIQYKKEGDVYVLTGRTLERLLYATDMTSYESMRYLQSLLLKKGVFDRLKEMGIEDGDTVRIIDYEFEYYA